mmetsp:Transcript_18370/g.42540  ORF Transcript_18370/g.42540 Transcript_18370/m.42540 type:complete len:93 (+) Transcript_18370:52-330(+)
MTICVCIISMGHVAIGFWVGIANSHPSLLCVLHNFLMELDRRLAASMSKEGSIRIICGVVAVRSIRSAGKGPDGPIRMALQRLKDGQEQTVE